MKAAAIVTFPLSVFAVLAQAPEQVSKKVADAIGMRPGAERTAQF